MSLKSFILLGLIGSLTVGCSNGGKAGKSNVAPSPGTYHVPPVDPNTSSTGSAGEVTPAIPSTQPSTSSHEILYPSTLGNASGHAFDRSLDTSQKTNLPSTGSIVPESLGTNSLDTGLPNAEVIGSDAVNTDELSTHDTFSNFYPSDLDTKSGMDTGSFGTAFGTESNVTNTSDEMPPYGATTDTGYVGTDYINNNIIDGKP